MLEAVFLCVRMEWSIHLIATNIRADNETAFQYRCQDSSMFKQFTMSLPTLPTPGAVHTGAPKKPDGKKVVINL